MTNISTDTGHMAYSKTGKGSQILLAFHGFGQDKEIFSLWGKQLGSKYTIYAFDLFYHGESDRKFGKLSKKEWQKYLQEFLIKEKVTHFSILGYSLGGRFAIASALAFPEKIQELILVGPDGVFLTLWFKLATTPGIRWIFKYIMLHPNRLENLILFNEKARIVNQYVADFVRKEMGSPENRKRVYVSWNHFKALGYRRNQLVKAFNKYSFKRRIILGNNDHIIKPKDILPIIEAMGDFKVDILPFKHHQLVNKEVAKLLLENYKI